MSYADYQSCDRHHYFGAYSCPRCSDEKAATARKGRRRLGGVLVLAGAALCGLSAAVHVRALVLVGGVLLYAGILLTLGR